MGAPDRIMLVLTDDATAVTPVTDRADRPLEVETYPDELTAVLALCRRLDGDSLYWLRTDGLRRIAQQADLAERRYTVTDRVPPDDEAATVEIPQAEIDAALAEADVPAVRGAG